ncbi:putative t-SNARE [Filobasidium floriforme]|uniref:putative t-SNARE n=1 Tax=Filobasidium floriforme TaxID=5210 RepID=UPI001E8DBC08|nr:putative t-SNARE [Filobasidium floriforme]KAH8088029.1 putative t-SNARE [Filobasidium floriforme]
MSFNDLERGMGPGSSGRSAGGPSQSEEEQAFTKLKDSVSIQIFKIQSNVQGITRLVDKLGTPQDSDSVRTSLTNLTEATRAMAKRTTEDVKKLASWPSESSSGGPSRKPLQSKISKDFTTALTAFQRIQKVSAERQKTMVRKEQKKLGDMVEDAQVGYEDDYGGADSERDGLVLQQVQQQQQQHIPPEQLAFQESLIAERESDIREIEGGIHELNEIFRDLGKIVEEQGGMIDNIESNIVSVNNDVTSAGEELRTAHDYQRKAGRRMLCLMLILAFVAAIVLLAILS